MTTWYDAPTGDTNAAIEQFARGLGNDAHGVIRRMKDPRFASRIADFARDGGIPLTPAQQRARGIMGDRMFSPGQVFLHFGIVPTRMQLAHLGDMRNPDLHIITREDLLAANTYTFLVPLLPYSLVDMRNKLFPRIWPGISPLQRGDGLLREPFAKHKGQVGWALLNPLQEEDALDARTLCYLILLRYFITGDLLYQAHEWIVEGPTSNGNPVRMRLDDRAASISWNRRDRERAGYRFI